MEMRRAVTTRTFRLALAGALIGTMTLSATVYALPKPNSTAVADANAIVGPDHQFLSGAITVGGSGELFAIHVVNAGEEEREITMKIVGPGGKVFASSTEIVGPDFVATLSYDPSSTTVVHAQISFASEVSIQDDSLIPTKGSA